MVDVDTILRGMGDAFRQKIDPEFSIRVEIKLVGFEVPWHVIVDRGRSVDVNPGPCNSPEFYLTTDPDTLQHIAEGELTAMTAAGQASASDPAPLGIEFADGVEFDVHNRVRLYSFLQRFFNSSLPEKTLLGERHARLVHGGHAIALYYHPGMRSAWFLLKKGDRLNQEGDTNPFPQAMVFIEGHGMAKIGDTTVSVAAGEAYYIPPNSDHVVWTDQDDLILIWLAWGEGA